jgi:hypothetical protein
MWRNRVNEKRACTTVAFGDADVTGIGTVLDGLGVRLPAPGWVVLDAVRQQRYTGELTLIGSPPVRLWADRGRIYRAEPLDSPPLAACLVAVGVLTPVEMSRGVVRAAGREHLGALFERVPTADRHTVEFAVATLTEDALREIAAQQLAAAESVPYAFDPVGTHQWSGGPGAAGVVDQPPATPAAEFTEPLAAPPADAVPASGPAVPTPPDTPESSDPSEPIDWDRLPFLDSLSNGKPASAGQGEGFAVIWPDGDVDRRPTAGRVATAQPAPTGTRISAATAGRLLDDRFGPAS